jgi:hypothetical protein
MFEIDKLSEVVAERQLFLEGQPGINVRVLLGKPQKASRPGGDLTLCPYQILGIGDEKVRCAGGVDAFQALQLAMEMIGSELYFKLNRRYDGMLRWDAGEEGDLGFPVPANLKDEI